MQSEELIKKAVTALLEKASNEQWMFIFKYLTDGCLDNADSLTVFKETHESILKDYENHLISENKAKNTIKEYLKSAENFIDFIKSKKRDLSAIDIFIVKSYLKEINQDISPNTYSKKVTLLKALINFLELKKIVKRDVVLEVKIPRKIETIKDFLTDEEIRIIENYLNQRKEKYDNENLRDKLIFYLGIDCGLRRQEIINIDWEDIDLHKTIILIKKSKGNKSREVGFPDKIRDYLLEYRKKTQYKGAVIRGIQGRRITKCALQHIIERIYKETGLKRQHLSLHSLRHTFADRHRRQGTRPELLMCIMGHSDIKTTLGYFHITREEKINTKLMS